MPATSALYAVDRGRSDREASVRGVVPLLRRRHLPADLLQEGSCRRTATATRIFESRPRSRLRDGATTRRRVRAIPHRPRTRRRYFRRNARGCCPAVGESRNAHSCRCFSATGRFGLGRLGAVYHRVPLVSRAGARPRRSAPRDHIRRTVPAGMLGRTVRRDARSCPAGDRTHDAGAADRCRVRCGRNRPRRAACCSVPLPSRALRRFRRRARRALSNSALLGEPRSTYTNGPSGQRCARAPGNSRNLHSCDHACRLRKRPACVSPWPSLPPF